MLVTTNAGADQAKDFILGSVGRNLSEDELEERTGRIFLDAVDRTFSPPIVGRFDLIYPYASMRSAARHALVNDYLNSEERLATESIRKRYALKGIKIDFDESAVDYIIFKFIDIHLGARRLTSQIEQQLVRNFLLPLEIRGAIVPGGRYRVSSDMEHFNLSPLK